MVTLGSTKIDVENPLFVDHCHSETMVFPHLFVCLPYGTQIPS